LSNEIFCLADDFPFIFTWNDLRNRGRQASHIACCTNFPFATGFNCSKSMLGRAQISSKKGFQIIFRHFHYIRPEIEMSDNSIGNLSFPIYLSIALSIWPKQRTVNVLIDGFDKTLTHVAYNLFSFEEILLRYQKVLQRPLISTARTNSFLMIYSKNISSKINIHK
jgi:hypothetical protein